MNILNFSCWNSLQGQLALPRAGPTRFPTASTVRKFFTLNWNASPCLSFYLVRQRKTIYRIRQASRLLKIIIMFSLHLVNIATSSEHLVLSPWSLVSTCTPICSYHTIITHSVIIEDLLYTRYAENAWVLFPEPDIYSRHKLLILCSRS